MSEGSALQWLRAPRLAEDTLPEGTRAVACRRCGRTVEVSLSPMRPPSFVRVEDQVECPEVQERWTGTSEGGLLLMMCGALEQSLEPDWETGDADAAAAHEPHSIVPPARPRALPEPAVVFSDRWDEDRHDDDHESTEPKGWLRTLLARSEGLRKGLVRATIGVLILGIVFLVGVLLPLREIKQLIHSPPAMTGSSGPQREALSAAPPQSPRRILLETTSAPSEAAQLGLRSPPSSFVLPRQATATESAPPSSAETAAAAAAEPEPKLRVPDLVAVAGGSFAMGGDDDSEQPSHQVSIRPFALGKHPVTVGEWKSCVAAASCPDIASGPDDRPVTNVSYDDTQAYLAWLSRATGKTFRLPTEAEWEYAARAGQRTRYWWGDRLRPGMANCRGCNGSSDAEQDQPPKIGSTPANPFGLFDMGGGVGQWVADNWHKNYKGAPSDGSAWLEEGSYARVIRSGSWKNGPADARAGSRDRYDGRIRHPTLGFRVASSS
ncbi:formylglycine-generating enzyme family protein [Bradyrhizobium sp. 83012]|uniref:Formylglycine-generating enzyme family protein n=1 Tax=Bradyrhizobium aeschynomenes TaxID=2734909 RepID=A0ABX2CLA9_9BRAD|nr:formylglycine-generating enzyme family protein [Bradyrhizobium aeschynomenes]NPU68077.1 formylglycine-generating enzyme family protein [Bradyrhizobium aeschynomenes]